MAGESKKTRVKIDRRTRQLRDGLWPNAPDRIWEYEKSDGWLNIPRAMPVIMRIMDSLTKGQPVSATYFELWCRTYNTGFVTASRPREMAFFSGFDGERAQRTWLSRVARLRELGFIDVKEGPSGPVSYILIENPYRPLKALHSQGMISDQFWNALMARLIEIGADDLDEPLAEESEADEPEAREETPKPATRAVRRVKNSATAAA